MKLAPAQMTWQAWLYLAITIIISVIIVVTLNLDVFWGIIVGGGSIIVWRKFLP